MHNLTVDKHMNGTFNTFWFNMTMKVKPFMGASMHTNGYLAFSFHHFEWANVLCGMIARCQYKTSCTNEMKINRHSNFEWYRPRSLRHASVTNSTTKKNKRKYWIKFHFHWRIESKKIIISYQPFRCTLGMGLENRILNYERSYYHNPMANWLNQSPIDLKWNKKERKKYS